jgi:hypothetical protein
LIAKTRNIDVKEAMEFALKEVLSGTATTYTV